MCDSSAGSMPSRRHASTERGVVGSFALLPLSASKTFAHCNVWWSGGCCLWSTDPLHSRCLQQECEIAPISAMVTWALKPFAASSCNRVVSWDAGERCVICSNTVQPCTGHHDCASVPVLFVDLRAIWPVGVPLLCRGAQAWHRLPKLQCYICCTIRAPNSRCAGAEIKQGCTIARCSTALICNRTEGRPSKREAARRGVLPHTSNNSTT
jgi:hypothetical protein